MTEETLGHIEEEPSPIPAPDIPVVSLWDPTPPPSMPQKPDLTTEQKLDRLFDLLKSFGWRLGEALHHIFAHKDSEIILFTVPSGMAWLTSPHGRGYPDRLMFDTFTPYSEIRTVRQALTAFAAQSCSDFLERESGTAVKPSGGLWAEIGNGTHEDSSSAEWKDLRTAIQEAALNLRTNQRLAVHFMHIIAEPKPRSRKGILTVRKPRPRDNVVTSCLAALDFCKNDNARLLPLARGILYLSSNVPMEIMSHNSRLAHTHPHTTMANHFHKQRDFRIGRENSMSIGIAGTSFQFRVDLAALDISDKRNRIIQSRRPQITVEDLLAMIDQPHIKNIGILQFIESLTNYIPHASVYKKELYLRYRTRVAKLSVPSGKTDIFPLGKNEASITELKDGLLDFLDQIGQVYGDYDLRLWFGGGDGMSYNNMLLLKKYLQNHPDPFQSFELLQPVLQLWHTMWTDLCRIFETHWGAPLNDNPDLMRNSAHQATIKLHLFALECRAQSFPRKDLGH
ncbi:hypothetical protein B0H11DRAFT_2241122 [Mycena galericulata]|nr:hypothetical protein B0H11DRAFT_2241122 [Mycena galericulata]